MPKTDAAAKYPSSYGFLGYLTVGSIDARQTLRGYDHQFLRHAIGNLLVRMQIPRQFAVLLLDLGHSGIRRKSQHLIRIIGDRHMPRPDAGKILGGEAK